jgi:hypothetical protein
MHKIATLFALTTALTVSSCVNDLDREPKFDVTSASVYADPANYKAVLAKLYAVMSVSGQQGPSGKPDISGIDEGTSNYMRLLWKLQELPTDEAVIGWNDQTIQDFHAMRWTSSDGFVAAMYNRIFYLVAASNEFIRETGDDRLATRNITGDAATNARTYRAEARFLRALAYYHAIDMFGNVPFVTEADAPGSFLPRQATRQELFNYVESELKALETELSAPRQAEYGRADQAAVWTLLAKLYLNAQVYTGTARWNDVITYTSKVIGANAYTLESTYGNLFLADNNSSRETILPVTFDGLNTKTYGGMTFLIHASIGGSMPVREFGVNSGWAGLRTTSALVGQFTDPSGRTDKRAMFYSQGQTLEIADITRFTDGYAVTKYKNVTRAGQAGKDPAGDFVDTDFPLFRLADVYLMYAEAVVRGGTGGSAANALNYVNLLRQRAYGGTTGNITAAQLTTDFILAERARELYWEGTRRTDLIRYNRFTEGTYLWPWKGGTAAGRAVEAFRALYPIPATDLVANPNLKQNTGY